MIHLHKIAKAMRDWQLKQQDQQAAEGVLTAASFMKTSQSFADLVLSQGQKCASPILPEPYAHLLLANTPAVLTGFSGMVASKGKTAQKGNGAAAVNAVEEDEFRYLTAIAQQEGGGTFVNVDQPETLRRVGIFHTCSLEDTPLLLGDIGRAYLYARGLGLPMEVMIALASWMSFNRSILQASGHALTVGASPLTPAAIMERLEVNAAMRRRFYASLQIRVTAQEILAYDQPGYPIQRGVLEEIAEYYLELAKVFYDVTGPIPLEKLPLIAKDKHGGADSRLPPSIRFLHRTGLLNVQTDEADLRVLKAVLQHFKQSTREVFMYWFAQFYGQREFAGDTLKSAVDTEERFDQALHQHGLHIEGRFGGGNAANGASAKALAAAYHPQYELGGLSVLPYTIISRDVVTQIQEQGENANLPVLLRKLCPLTWPMDIKELTAILKATKIYPLNLLLGDLTSFLLLCQRACPLALQDACKLAGLQDGSMSQVFKNLGAGLSWELEVDLPPGKETVAMWMSWLRQIELNPGPGVYTPMHIWFALHEKWPEEAYGQLAQIFMVVRNFYQLVTQNNWAFQKT